MQNMHLLTYYDIGQFEETPSIGEKQTQIVTVVCNEKILLSNAWELHIMLNDIAYYTMLWLF